MALRSPLLLSVMFPLLASVFSGQAVALGIAGLELSFRIEMAVAKGFEALLLL